VLERGLLDAEAAKKRSLEVLRSVRMPDPEARLRQYPHELSGGQRQRAAIAMALMTQPDLLVADEPTTALDVTVQAQVLEVLREARDRGLALVLITHDLGVVAGIADRVAVMYGGRIVESAPVRELFAGPAHPYTAALLASVPRLDAALTRRLAGIEGQPPRPGVEAPGCAFAPRCPATTEQCRVAQPGLRAAGERAWRATRRWYASESRGERALLEVRGLTVRFPLRRAGLLATRHWLTAVDGVDLEVAAGQSVGIVGESGCGKSTLARAILALLRPAAGSVAWRGTLVRPGDAPALRRMRREAQVVFQDPVGSLDPRMTVGESVAEALVALAGPQPRAARDSRVAATLQEVGLDPALAARYPHELSGGQCQRAAIARAIVARPALLVCDEAVSALDVSVQAQIVTCSANCASGTGLRCCSSATTWRS